jgi:hypothetical protein
MLGGESMMMDPNMTVDEWIAFFAVITAIFSVGIFIVMCGVAIMKAVGVF